MILLHSTKTTKLSLHHVEGWNVDGESVLVAIQAVGLGACVGRALFSHGWVTIASGHSEVQLRYNLPQAWRGVFERAPELHPSCVVLRPTTVRELHAQALAVIDRSSPP
jgi:hypothetical protein